MFFKSFKQGVKLKDFKELTASCPIERIEAPDYIVLPMSMHIGAPAKPLVKKGDYVLKGQKVAEAQGLISSNIHSGVSGTVTGLERRYLPNGALTDCLIIKNDRADAEMPAGPFAPEELSAEEIRSRLLENGITGMGGASFPTHVKYLPLKKGCIDTVVLNGIECEPYITCDYRVLLEYAPEVIRGLKYFMLAAGAGRGIIAIEENKPEAIRLFEKLLAGEQNISLAVCLEKYPQGSEKQLVYAVTGRIVPQGGLPSETGVVVDNVATAVAAARAVEANQPLTERVVTVSGSAVARPGNFIVPIGTLFDHVVKFAGGLIAEPAKIIFGGPMMGFAIPSLVYLVFKGNIAIFIFDICSAAADISGESPCVRCGRCVDACPMLLMPTLMMKAVKKRDWEQAEELAVQSCIECGCCSYVCPAHIPVVQYIRLGKQFLATDKTGGVNPYFK